MSHGTEHEAGDPAPNDGRYEALNVFGRETGHVIQLNAGERLPDLPKGFSWRRLPPRLGK